MTRPMPPQHQLNELCEGLLALRIKTGKKGEQIYEAERLVQRVRRAYDRDRTGSSVPDGFPRGSSGGGGSPGLPTRPVETGEWFCRVCKRTSALSTPTHCFHCGPQTKERMEQVKESVVFTSPELAFIDREENRKSERDHHHDLTLQLLDAFASCVHSLDLVRGLAARIDNLVDVSPDENGAEAGCRSCARYRDGSGRQYFSPATSESGGRKGLCQWCNGWVSDVVANPEGAFPPVELIERRARGERITTKVLDEVKAAAKRRAS